MDLELTKIKEPLLIEESAPTQVVIESVQRIKTKKEELEDSPALKDDPA